jgi:hypothetical protein
MNQSYAARISILQAGLLKLAWNVYKYEQPDAGPVSTCVYMLRRSLARDGLSLFAARRLPARAHCLDELQQKRLQGVRRCVRKKR